MKFTKDEIREHAEKDLRVFAALVNPTRVYGEIHNEVFDWFGKSDGSLDQLLLLPRSHMKSHCIAVWVAWWITKKPWTTVLYVSATEDLAEEQVYAIKQIFESDIHRKYWPELIHPEESKRERWTSLEVKVDHPKRKQMGVRDATLLAKSVKSNSTGLHCDVLVYDDLVVPANAYTMEGRSTVAAADSQFSSVANPGAITKAVGTRYHPGDIYGTWLETTEEIYDDKGNVTGERPQWEVLERVVEEEGVFLWPREYSPVTRQWYGFNQQVLSKKRAKYFANGERAQYFAQYYNNPNDAAEAKVDLNAVPRYNREKLQYRDGKWYVNGNVLAVYAAADFAYTTGKRSDWTAFAVVGVDSDNFVYILDLEQIKTDKYEDYYKLMFKLHDDWGFRKIKLETNAGANVIVTYLKDRIRQEGLSLVVDGRPSLNDKIERCEATLIPAYSNNRIYHYRGGWMAEYEEQVRLPRPKHDDLRDAVAMAVEIAKPPLRLASGSRENKVVPLSTRFGGFTR